MTKPILTKQEVEPIRKLCNHPAADTMLRILETIEQAVELLRFAGEELDGYCNAKNCRCAEIKAFLARYDGKDGGK